MLQKSDPSCSHTAIKWVASPFHGWYIDLWSSNDHDESVCDRRKKFAYTRIPPVDHRLFARGTRYSAIAAISIRGVQDVVLVEGSVNGQVFTDFVKDSLVPILQPFNCTNPNSIVVMDNASIHHVDTVAEHILQTGALLRFQQSQGCYETKWSAISNIQSAKTIAFDMITENDSKEYAKCCGYNVM